MGQASPIGVHARTDQAVRLITCNGVRGLGGALRLQAAP